MGSDNQSIFWRNLALVAFFFVLTPVVLIASLITIFSINPNIQAQAKTQSTSNNSINTGARVYASLPAHTPTISGSINVADARPEIVKEYLEEYNSPLVPFAQKIVEFC